MTYEFRLQQEPFELESDFATELIDTEWESEVNRRSRDYISWVQQSLNRIMGLRLAVDGISGTQTRSAIRSFQQRQGLKADGVVGSQTEQALTGAGASLPPLVVGGGTIVMPPLAVRVRPFVVLSQFVFKQPSLPSSHSPIIQRIAHLVIASWSTSQPITDVRLVGHTDPVGSAAFNDNLGQQRALDVRQKLLSAIGVLQGQLPSGAITRPVNVIAQSLGETKPIASNATSAGRARNRRVEVFIPTTCQGFFAQYDLRFLPGDPIFGIPANPQLASKGQREAEVSAMVGELHPRRDARAAAALLGNIPPAAPVQGGILTIARSLSAAQLALYREFLPDGSGGIEFQRFQDCFEQFANGELRTQHPTARIQGVGEPNGGFFFLFAEFAFLCIDSGIDVPLWTQALRTFVNCQEIFMHVYRPVPPSPAVFPLPPPVGATLPASCPTPRSLDAFNNANFNARGQSNTVRKQALRSKYAPMGVAALRAAARDNMRRAQCMP